MEVNSLKVLKQILFRQDYAEGLYNKAVIR